jgi:hypothetical protein
MSTSLAISLALAALYLIFLFWYGGRGTPLTRAEIDQALGRLEGGSTCKADPSSLVQLRTVLSNDDGREFVMHKLVRWRTNALYLPGSPDGDDVRAADKRYLRAIVWPLIKSVCLDDGRRWPMTLRLPATSLHPESADE